MPTITYTHEPTDEVYFIDYSDDLKAETVVKGTIYRIDMVIRSKVVAGSGAVEQVPSVADVAAAQTLANSILPNLTSAIAARDVAQEALDEQQRLVAINPLLNADAEAQALGLAQDFLNNIQLSYDAAVADTVITTEASQAVESQSDGLVVKYVLRTAYDQNVVIEDETLIFTDKMAAFDALELRTA